MSRQHKIIDIFDILFCRYGDMQSFNRLSLKLCIKLIKKCFKEQEKKRCWDMWISVYPRMTKDNYISFEKFYTGDTDLVVKKSEKTKEELFEMQKDIMEKIQNGQFKEVKM